MSNSARSSQDATQAAWATAPWFVHETVGSTNDLALTLAHDGAPDGTAVVADQQTDGRGRHGRSWWSPPGAGMYLSVVVRPGRDVAQTAAVTLAAGVALATAVRNLTALPVELKWPNDLVIGRPWRKLAGILCEASQLGGDDGVVIVGMGVNLRRSAYPPEIADRATSISEECPHDIERDRLALECRQELARTVGWLRAGAVAAVLDEWRGFGRAALDRAPVRWRDGAGEHRGTTIGLSDDGALLVRAMGAQTSQRIVAGEVMWEMLTRD